jgi:hypothetical protein
MGFMGCLESPEASVPIGTPVENMPTKTTALAKTNQLAVRDSRDLIKAVAMDIGKEVAHHIEIQYPEAVKAASSTFLLSVRNCTSNNIMAWLETDGQDTEKRLAFNDRFRRHMRKMWKQIREE